MTSAARQRLMDEIVQSASVLGELDSQAAAEAWASGAIADWVAHDGDIGELVAELAESAPKAQQTLGWLIDSTTLPVRHQPIAAVTISDDDSRAGPIATVIDYATDGTPTHSVSITADDGQLTDAVIGPPGLAGAADADGDLTIRSVGLDDAIATVRSVLLEASVGGTSPDSLANLAVIAARVDVPLADLVPLLRGGSEVHDLTPPERDADDDRYAAGVMSSALGEPSGLGDALAELRVVIERSSRERPDEFEALAEVAGVSSAQSVESEHALTLIGAYLAPRSLATHDRRSAELLLELEWADWLGAIIGLVRAGAGTEVTGQLLVDLVNRCPEVTTTIPASDRDPIAWAFEAGLYAWELCGVLDEDGRLTPAGAVALGPAAVQAWMGDPSS